MWIFFLVKPAYQRSTRKKQNKRLSALLMTVVCFFGQTAYGATAPSSQRGALFDVTLFQGNLGWADFTASNTTLNALEPSLRYNAKFIGSGAHAAISLVDLNRLQTYLVGGRFGAQVFSNASGVASIPRQPITANTRTYILTRTEGIFADFILAKSNEKRPVYVYGFAGLGYDRYMLKGYQPRLADELPRLDTKDLEWTFAGRVGAGLGYKLTENYTVGIEYTYLFGQSFEPSSGTVFPGKDHGSTIDATFSVLIGW